MLARFESVITETDDCNCLWNLWYENFLDVCNTHAPFRSFKVEAKQCPWITSEIRELMSQRDKTLKLANDTKSPPLMVKYRYLRNSITTLLRKAKQKYYHDGIINISGNSKSMSKYYDRPLIIHITKMIFPQTRLIPLKSILLMLDVKTMIF